MTNIVKGDFTVVKGPGPEPSCSLQTAIQWLLLHIAERAAQAEGDTLEDLTNAFADRAILLDRYHKLCDDLSAFEGEVRATFWL
jgi:hypothetical protein